MKKTSATLALFALCVTLLLFGVPQNDAGAQGRPDDPGHQSAVRADGKVVAPDGVVFDSQKAFIDAGRKCNTRHVDDLEMEKIGREVAAHRSANGGGPAGGGSTDAARVYSDG